MPPTKAIVELAEAAITSPAVKSAAETALKAGAALLEDFFKVGVRSGAKTAINGAEKQIASGASSSASNWTSAAERLLLNPKDDKAVTSLIGTIEKPLQGAAAKTAKELGVPLTEAHKTAMTELAQDKVLTTRLGLMNGDLQPRSVTELQKHLEKSVATDFRTTFQKFLPGRNEAAAENLGLMRGTSVDPFERMVTLDRQRVVDGALKTLTPRRAEAIQSKFYEGLSTRRTSEAMGVSDSRVLQLEESATRNLKLPVLEAITPSKMYSPAQLFRGKLTWKEVL